MSEFATNELGLGPISDEELERLALAADPRVSLADDAQPWWGSPSWTRTLLPDWYMPLPAATRRGRGTRIVVGVLVSGFLIVGAFGLCITSGFLSLA